jgi:hypothetical protein
MGKKLIILLDVDDTSAVSNKWFGIQDGKYQYNDPLFRAIQNCGVENQLYLFTVCTVAGCAKNIQEEPISTPSRLKLTQYLQKQFQINVQKTVTFLDPIYKKGIGCYFEDVIKPFEAYILAGEDLRNGAHTEAFKEACEGELKLADEFARLKEKDKGMLLAYMAEQLKLSFPEDEFVMVAFDDSRAQLEAMRSISEKLNFSLLPVLVKAEFNQEHYEQLLRDLNAKEFSQGFKHRFGQISDKFAALKRMSLSRQGSTGQVLRQFDHYQQQEQGSVGALEPNAAKSKSADLPSREDEESRCVIQ